MEFTIHHADIKLPNGDNAVGLEIQPPIAEIAAISVVAELTRKKDGFSNGREHFAEEAAVTRNDEAGTAITIRLNKYRNRSSSEVAQAVGALINPAAIHTVILQP